MQSFEALLNDLARAIRRLREPTGLSQERFASSIKRHRTKIGYLERGKGNPTLKTLYKVADGLGVSVAHLFALAAGEGGGAEADAESLGAREQPQPGKAVGRSQRAAKPSRRGTQRRSRGK
jgi:transcriptional regulator with XRE-family HTH domain